MKKIALGILGMLLVLASACGKMDDSDNSDDLDVNVEGYVYDGVTEVALKDVKVTGSFGSKKTDADGYYAIKGLEMGQFRFEVEAEGYMTKVLTPSFMEREEDFKGDELSFLLTTFMYKKETAISTQLLKSTGPTYQTLSGLPYVIELLSPYKNRFIYGRTDANGMITDTVPNDYFKITVDTVIGDFDYSLMTSTVSPENLQKAYMVTLTDLTVDPFYVTSTNMIDEEGAVVYNFDPQNLVTVTFNSAIDKEESVIELSKWVSGNYYLVKAELVYREGDKTVSVKPYDGVFEAGANYKLDVAAVAASDENSTYSSSFSFSTSTEVISSLSTPEIFRLKSPATIEETTTNISFQIRVDEKSTDIEIYGRYDNDLEFVEMYNSVIPSWTTDVDYGIVMFDYFSFYNLPGIVEPSAGFFSDNNDFEIMIRSKVQNNGEWVISEFSEVFTIRNNTTAY